jgi:hypothetical protein
MSKNRVIVQSTKSSKENHMSKPVPAPVKNAPAQAAAAKANGSAPVATAAPVATPAPEGEKAKKAKRAKVRLVSTTIPGLWVRAFVDVIAKHGTPRDPNGQEMVPGKAPSFGITAEERETRKAAKEAEKARFEAMSDEDKLSYAKARREKKQAEQAAKKASEREALIAQLRAEMAAGKIA